MVTVPLTVPPRNLHFRPNLRALYKDTMRRVSRKPEAPETSPLLVLALHIHWWLLPETCYRSKRIFGLPQYGQWCS